MDREFENELNKTEADTESSSPEAVDTAEEKTQEADAQVVLQSESGTTEAPGQEDKKKKKGIFSLFLKIYVGVLVLVAAVALTYVWSLLADYEKHLPQNVAEDYAASITAERVNNELKKLYEKYDTEYFSLDIPETTYENITVVENIVLSQADSPVYSVYVGSRYLLDITLSKNGKSEFNFDRYYVSGITWRDDFYSVSVKEYTIVVPRGATLGINGKLIVEKYITSEDADYRFVGKYDDNSLLGCVEYTIEVPVVTDVDGYGLNVSAVLGEYVLEYVKEGESIFFEYPQEMKNTVEITVPLGAEVKLNGVLLTDGTAIAYPNLSRFDAASDNVPMLEKYTVSGFFDAPTVTARLGETSLESDGAYFFDYPESERYSVVLTIPIGAVCTVNGITLGESELVGISDHVRADAVHAFWGVTLQNTVKYEKYVIEGLIREPVVHTDYEMADMPDALEDACNSFISKYVSYVSMGYYDTMNNLNKVLVCLVPYTDTYTMMSSSYYAIMWNTPYTSVVFNKLETTKVDKVADNCYYCEIAFDITMSVSNITNEFKGTYRLVFTESNGSWLLFSFEQ